MSLADHPIASRGSERWFGTFGDRPDDERSDPWGLTLSDTASVPLAVSADDLPDFVTESDGSVPAWERASYRTLSRVQEAEGFTPRFGPEWAKDRRADVLQAVSTTSEWATTTALLTLRAEPFLMGSDRPLPPVRHLDLLAESRSARQSRLYRILDEHGGRGVIVRGYGAHRSGHAHRHVAVVAEAVLTHEDFRPVITSHVDNCPTATADGHGDPAVQVSRSTDLDGLSDIPGAVGYVSQQIPGISGLLSSEGAGQQTLERKRGISGGPDRNRRLGSAVEAGGYDVLTVDTVGVDTG